MFASYPTTSSAETYCPDGHTDVGSSPGPIMTGG